MVMPLTTWLSHAIIVQFLFDHDDDVSLLLSA